MSEEKIVNSKKENIIQAVKFSLFSASAGLIQFCSFTLLNELPEKLGRQALPYWICYLVSLVLSVVWNFTLNRKFTFKSANNVPIAMLKVAGYYLVFTPLSTFIGNKIAEAGGNHYAIEIVTMLANFVTEFIFDKFVVFRGSENTNNIANKEKKQ